MNAKYLQLLPVLADFLRRLSQPGAWKEPSTYVGLGVCLLSLALGSYLNDMPSLVSNLSTLLAGVAGIIGMAMKEKIGAVIVVQPAEQESATQPEGQPK